MAHRSTSYRRRVAISVVTTATASTSDVVFAPPDGWDEFWNLIDASGYGIRLTEADGVTALTYAWTGFNKANRAGTIQIESAPTPSTAGKCVLYWLYYDVDSPTDGSGSVSIGSPLTASLDMAAPDPEATVLVRPKVPLQTAPGTKIAKSTTDELYVWLDFSRIVQRVSTPYNGRYQWEEPAVAAVEVQDTSGSTVASMTDAADMRWVSIRQGTRDRVLLKLRVKAGTTATKYTLIGEFFTATPDESPYRTIEERIGIYVYDQLET